MAFYRPWISKVYGITKNDKSLEVYGLLSRFMAQEMLLQ
mgnify:CR=1 FL=1|jgi:hypothetical protein